MADTALPPISRTPDANPAFEVRALFSEGLATVRALSSGLWTDHNTHDPGITMLEQACYALTELAYRHSLPIEDRLAGDADPAAQFHAADAVLPNRPYTELDWRKTLIDLPGVKNAWIESVKDVLLYADLRRRELRQTPPEHPDFQPVPLGGLYRVRVECMESVTTAAGRDAVLARVRERLETSRNLCEDLIEVRPVRAEYFALCAEIDLASDADVTECAAQLLFAAGEVLAPPVLSHDLPSQLARGRTLAEVLDGPLPAYGFIDDAELLATALPAEIHLSDVIRAVAETAGVRSVRTLVLNPIQRADEADDNALDAAPTAVVGDAVSVANPWRIPVRPGRLPRLSLSQGRLVFSKRGLAVQGWNIAAMPTAVATRLAALREAARLRVETATPTTLPIPPTIAPTIAPIGQARPLADWTSFQLDFPALYGIGAQGLSGDASDLRRAQALQLKGWLLFFDQLMADQLALLAQARLRLSVAPAALHDVAHRFAPTATELPHVLVSQVVRSVIDHAALYPPAVSDATLADAIESRAEAEQRQQRLLDHLLARLAEDFADYAGAMASAFGQDVSRLIGDKSRFLQDVAAAVHDRAGAMRQRPPTPAGVWNTDNVSGLERRLAGLLGIADCTRRNLGLVSYDTYNQIDQVPDGIDEYRFRVRHAVTHAILLSSSTHYPTPEAARAEMIQAIARGQQPDGYQRLVAHDGRHYFNIVAASGDVLARRIQYFGSAALMDAAIAELMAYLQTHYSGEGLYVVEHILLRPQAADDPLLPICTDPGCADCTELDPYSHRIQVVLPAYAGRFQALGFRQFVEQTIRREVPAHILPTVCWIGADDMARFESAWRDWLELAAGFSSVDRPGKLQKLIDALVGVKNIYPVRALFDCVGDDSKPPFILGKTSLGRGPAG
ncbi:MAG: hypothetical protein AB3X44_17155 [Leptothrix sp. (in: b-proteobacteria)]